MRGVRNEYKKGLWTVEEDKILSEYIKVHGEGRWNQIPQATGLKRCRKSCRLRWVNYLCPNVKHGDFSSEEEDLIIRLHNLLGNRWSLIAGRVPGRTDNQVKNHWNANLSKKLGLDGPRCRDNAPTTATTAAASRHLKHLKGRLTASSYREPSSDKKAAELDNTASRSTGPASRRGEAEANVGPSTSVWFLDDELSPAYAPNIMESLGDFRFDFILYGR